MDWKTFTASMFGSLMLLAWPAALVIVFWMFKKELKDLLPRARIKYGDAELGFIFEKAEEKVAEIQANSPESPPPVPETVQEADEFSRLLAVSPRAAVLAERKELDKAIRERVAEYSAHASQPIPISRAIEQLRKAGAVDETTYELLRQLQSIGNAAAHSS